MEYIRISDGAIFRKTEDFGNGMIVLESAPRPFADHGHENIVRVDDLERQGIFPIPMQ